MNRFILVFCFISILLTGNLSSQTLFFNNSLFHVHSNDASGLTVDHELGYFKNLNDFVAFGPSVEFSYFANDGRTTHQLMLNANLVLSTQIGRFTPSLGLTGSLSRVFPNDDGTAYSISLGSSIAMNDNWSFFLQGKYYQFTNDMYLGRFLTQFGLSYVF